MKSPKAFTWQLPVVLGGRRASGEKGGKQEGAVVGGGTQVEETTTTGERTENIHKEMSSYMQPTSIALSVFGRQGPGPGV